MIRCVIIEDEKKSRDILSTLIERYTSNVEICGYAATVAEAKNVIADIKPELVFLDISMPDGNGFDLLHSQKTITFEIIFTTAYGEYALQAIKHHALDYLLKPIDITELQKAILNVQQKINEKQKMHHYNSTKAANSEHNQQYDKIAVPNHGGLKFINSQEIIYLHAKGAYTEIICKNNIRFVSSQPLKHYEETLPKILFYRTHHSYIVNLSCIEQFRKEDGTYVVMNDGSEVILSKRRKKDFLSLFLR